MAKKLKCIKPWLDHLTLGKVYDLIEVSGNYVRIMNDRGFISGYLWDKFEVVEDTKELKEGDWVYVKPRNMVDDPNIAPIYTESMDKNLGGYIYRVAGITTRGDTKFYLGGQWCLNDWLIPLEDVVCIDGMGTHLKNGETYKGFFREDHVWGVVAKDGQSKPEFFAEHKFMKKSGYDALQALSKPEPSIRVDVGDKDESVMVAVEANGAISTVVSIPKDLTDNVLTPKVGLSEGFCFVSSDDQIDAFSYLTSRNNSSSIKGISDLIEQYRPVGVTQQEIIQQLTNYYKQSEEDTIMTTPIKVEKITFINGVDVDKVTEAQLHGWIRQSQESIKALKELDVKSSRVDSQIDKIQAGIDAAVAILDSHFDDEA